MLEYWNYGIMGPSETGEWFVGKITLTGQSEILINGKFLFKITIPLFQV